MVRRFVAAVASRVAAVLPQSRDGWLVQNDCDGKPLDDGVWVAVSHRRWPSDPESGRPASHVQSLMEFQAWWMVMSHCKWMTG